MPKLAWVLLPLAATAAWLVLLAWRGRRPARPALNVLVSMLLLAYVGGTAGLGIFWVAHQQLPVFDWHYTFGYATVLLLVVHLAFNLRIVWQHLKRLARQGGRREARPEWSAATGAASAASAADSANAADAARPAKPVGGLGRRPLMGWTGAGALAAATGLGYFIGLRHGRTEFVADSLAGSTGSTGSDPPPASSMRPELAAAQAWAVVEQFHAFSSHSRTRVLRHAASTDWGGAPPLKRAAGEAVLRLPAPAKRAGAAATAPGATAAAPPDLETLATWLWHAAGISERRGGIDLRAAPSSGALFATELYVLAPGSCEGTDGGGHAPATLRGLPPGTVWRYDTQAHALRQVNADRAAPGTRAEAPGTPAAPLATLPLPTPCHAVVVATAVFARSGHKYGDRTYRYVLADLGHALENLRQVVDATVGLHTALLPRFDEQALATALALDERQEGVLAVAVVTPAPGAVAAVPATPVTSTPATPATPAPPAAARAAPAAVRPTATPRATTAAGADAAAAASFTSAWRTDRGGLERIGLTEAVHAATSLRALPAASAAIAASAAPADPAPSPSPMPDAEASPEPPAQRMHLLPSPRASAADPLPLIARRRSRRRFAATPLSQQAIADVLQAMTRVPPQLSRAVRIDLVTPRVEGLPPAAWRCERADEAGAPLRLHRRVTHDATLARRARAAALDQDVIGDAAAVFVLSLDRAALIADPAGAARGWRHGFIEAGLVGERVYLAAAALGLGACAVGAFYDDEAAALIGLDPAREWPVHFAALGVPG